MDSVGDSSLCGRGAGCSSLGPGISAGVRGEPRRGGQIVDHGIRHTGVDLTFQVGEQVILPIAVTVIGIVEPVGDGPPWSGLILQGQGPWTDFHFRLLGLTSTLNNGDSVPPGTSLRDLQDSGALWPGVRPYLHVELYHRGFRIDPKSQIGVIWPDHPSENPGAGVDMDNWHLHRLIQAGELAQDEGRLRETLDIYAEALLVLDWETSNPFLLRWTAEILSDLGDFEQAAEVQQRYLDQLEMELFYADGNLPDVALGPIAAVQSSQSLLIYIAHGTDNLGAYLAGQPTVIFD